MIPKELGEKKQKILEYVKNLWISVQEKDIPVLLQAFVHKSFAADFKYTVEHNERLEFVGDGILGACINKMLFIDYPTLEESDLTLFKISLVRQETLAMVAKDIDLDKMIFVSKGEEKMAGRQKDAILSDSLEALIGYIYICQGEKESYIFIQKFIYPKIQDIQQWPTKSYKTLLQEYTQKKYKTIPEYKDIEHEKDEKGNVVTYKTEIYVQGKKKAEWFWTNKKKAQEEAAKVLIENKN